MTRLGGSIEVTVMKPDHKLPILQGANIKLEAIKELISPSPWRVRSEFEPMPPQTRSATRPRTSSARTRASQKAQAHSKSIQKRMYYPTVAPSLLTYVPPLAEKVGPKSKPKRKPKPKQEPEPEPTPELEPPRKRTRRSSAKHGSHEAPKKLVLMNMPIARYVHPLDLIMLSRVNKFFRELFLDKRSVMIWRSAHENVPGLPPCPDGICEPQYAVMLFTKRCSICAGYAPREMDPALLVRLCVRCREQELVDIVRVTDQSLLMASRGIVPGRANRWRSWCLYDEARAVKIKLNELNEAGDEEALRRWKGERHKLIKSRKQIKENLSKWLKNREQAREKDLNNLKSARQKEIESRLIELGWERGDFLSYEGWRDRQWQSMVRNVKPLTDRIWDNILPHLLGHLEINRNQRLERERCRRLGLRRNAVYNWVNTTRSQLPPFARIEPAKGGHPATDASNGWAAFDLTDPNVRQPFPSTLQVHEWEVSKTLIDTDVPEEQFFVDFENKKPLLQQSVVDWQHELGKQLIKLLPADTRPPNFMLPPTNLVLVAGETPQPISTLPEDIQKLLRADAIFSIMPSSDQSSPILYPHGFHSFASPIQKTYYHTKASDVAKALLIALGYPDASHLGMTALGRTFRCGRCPSAAAVKFTWMGIVEHYLESIRSWQAIARQPSVRSNKEFVYVCTHDVDSENSARPLVHTGGASSGHTSSKLTRARCIPCRSLGLSDQMLSQAIVDHLRDVHLIEEPEEGTHYKFL